VVALTIDALLRANVSAPPAVRLRSVLDASAPPPRDPTRIVEGTRRRGGKGTTGRRRKL
jgi:hypothetical protein